MSLFNGASAFVALVLISACFPGCGRADDTTLFGGIQAREYLRGRFSPAEHPLFVELSSMGIPTDGRQQYLRREAAEAFLALYKSFRESHPHTPFRVVSATRTWADQKWIWENKWSGATPVDGTRLNEAYPGALGRAKIILRYSSMPGTSRHHWGTDLDLNELYNEYYDRGDGAILYQWMKINAGRFGFCQPYTAGRTAGYQEERWHWSYVPLSAGFLSRWETLFGASPAAFTADALFQGAVEAGHLAIIYVNAVNEACK
ncbi:MAG: D-alanyl-D-alanine carboxypeptidase family protein [Spirochaetes bacterium]|nr:MAG: D-alanyl-D-alanine carboxypeptidase family protein [Spirochaetota bacterium]